MRIDKNKSVNGVPFLHHNVPCQAPPNKYKNPLAMVKIASGGFLA
jgi:hypothetical protein